jgi:hypothetical protein
MFACIRRGDARVSVRTDSIEAAEMLIEHGIGAKAPYVCRSWINLSRATSASLNSILGSSSLSLINVTRFEKHRQQRYELHAIVTTSLHTTTSLQ